MTGNKKVWAIIPAGGVGARMSVKTPKQYLRIHGRTVLHHTLSRICASPAVDGVVVGIGAQDKLWLHDPFVHPKILGVYGAGVERVNTVFNGLKFLGSLENVAESDWVLVHDAVRPCLMGHDIQNLVDQAENCNVGAVLGKKLVDTLKKTDAGGKIQGTVDRETVWRAFTPQIFPLGKLLQAIETSITNNFQVTDESSAMEHIGVSPLMVEGHPGNIKITTDDDLEHVAIFLGNN